MNIAHSVFDRLKTKSKSELIDFNYLLQRYAIERLLYRLSVSQFRDRFVLKGATLFQVWSGHVFRITRDVDFLAYGENDLGALQNTFQEIAKLGVDDGVIFDPENVVATPIRDDQEYGGVRIVIRGHLHSAKLAVQVDVGFGDAVTPEAIEATIPSLLDQPPPCLRAYPRYTVVAEKFEAMVRLGMGNSRMKDFYDILMLLQQFEFDSATLVLAVHRTFSRRNTPLPNEVPLALTPAFAQDAQKMTQWRAFERKAKLHEPVGSLENVIDAIRAFLEPILGPAAAEFGLSWTPTKGWHRH